MEQGVEDLKAEMQLLKQEVLRKSRKQGASKSTAYGTHGSDLLRSESIASFRARTPTLGPERRRSTR